MTKKLLGPFQNLKNKKFEECVYDLIRDQQRHLALIEPQYEGRKSQVEQAFVRNQLQLLPVPVLAEDRRTLFRRTSASRSSPRADISSGPSCKTPSGKYTYTKNLHEVAIHKQGRCGGMPVGAAVQRVPFLLSIRSTT